MPILTVDMTAGTLTAWRKRVGDAIKRGDIIAEVETDKGLIDVEAFTAGVIESILVQAGETVPTGTVLAIIREEAGAPVSVAASAPPGAITEVPGRLRISPLARQVAAELCVDPASVRGTGLGGAVTREDVERAAAARLQAPARPVEPPDRQARMRQLIGAAMARSKREIPHYYLGTTIDMFRAMTWLAEENLKRPVTERLLPGVLLMKATALALREVPELNAVWRGTEAVPSPAIHIGVAISLRGGGLVAPALHDADRRSLGDLMTGLRDLVRRARSGGLRSSELSDPTVTVTSLGEQGVETVFGIIYPPQVAIVGFGKVVERPWVVEGRIVARPVLAATLSADHRVSDGHRGGLFLAAVDRLLQEPGRL
ncbi:MAG: putative Pyruvate dehydrogenase complex, dihydrolipoamide acetyltransferase (E2) component [Candidatus Rokubacteria bacterium]|nr:putative Pyruvate dehydrogenase complex, dihydrolipoamide acetyltransferase (E2) component [Candidatus Rokubacteria bacterium]